MSETPAKTPAAANVVPINPEAALYGSMDGLVAGAFTHYETLSSRSRQGANVFVPERTVKTHNYRDGTQRQVVTDGTDGLVESKLYLTDAVVDQYGRRVLLVATTYKDGRTERDLRFLPSSRQNENTYRWSEGQPVSEVLSNDRTLPLTSNSAQFNEAWHLTNQVAARFQVLCEQQSPGGSIRVGRAAGSLAGTLIRAVMGRSRS